MSASGFHYDTHLRLLLDIRLIGLNKIRTRCKRPSASWALFDLALQTLSAGLFDARHTKLYIPISVDEVFSNFPSWSSNDQGQWTFHGEVTKREKDIVEGNVYCFSRGTLVGHLKGIRAIRSFPTTQAENLIRKDRRLAISTDDESYNQSDGGNQNKKKRRKSRSQHGYKKSTEQEKEAQNEYKESNEQKESQATKHASFSSIASDFIDNSRRKSSSTASKIALAVNTLKRAKLQKDFPLRLQNRFKMKDEEVFLVIRGSYGQFATDELEPIFESISQQSYSRDVFLLEQSKKCRSLNFVLSL